MKSSEESLEIIQGHQTKIVDHLTELEEYKKKVSDAKMGAMEIYENAMGDSTNLDALREHKVNAAKQVEEA